MSNTDIKRWYFVDSIENAEIPTPTDALFDFIIN